MMPQPPDSTTRGPQLLILALLGAITAVAAALRLVGVDHSLWADELHTAWAVSGGLGDVAQRAAMGNHAPLYFWITWLSTQVVGLNEWGLRLPSLAAGILLVPAAFYATRRLAGSPWAGLLAAALVAIERPTFLYFSQEARPYALVQLLAVVQVTAFFGFRGGPRLVSRAVFVVTTLALFYVHYTTILILTGELAWYAWRAVRGRGKSVSRTQRAYRAWLLLVDLLIILVGCVPAVPALQQIAARRQLWTFVGDMLPQTLELLITLLGAYLAGPAFLAFCVQLALWKPRRRKRQAPRDEEPDGAQERPASAGLFLAYVFFVPVLLARLATARDWAALFFPRYVMASLAVLPLATGWASQVWPARTARVAFAVAALGLVGYFAGPVQSFLATGSFAGHLAEDWRAAAAFVRGEDPEGRLPVLLRPGLIEADELLDDEPSPLLRDYLASPVATLYSLGDRTVHVLPNSAFAQLADGQRADIRAAGGTWLIVRGRADFANEVAWFLERQLSDEQRLCETVQRRELPGVMVMRLQLKPAQQQ